MIEEEEKTNNFIAQERLALLAEGSKIAEMFWEIHHKTKLSFDDILWMSQFFGDYALIEGDKKSQVNQLFEILTKLQTYGKVSHLNKDVIENLIDTNPTFVDEYMAAFELGFEWVRQHELHPYTREAMRAYHSPRSLSFSDYSDSFWLQWMGGKDVTDVSEGGGMGWMVGKRGSGKTDFTLLLGEIAIRNGMKFASNVGIESPNEEQRKNIQYFGSFSELLRTVLENAMQGFRTYSVIDEMTVSGARKQRAQSRENLQLEEYQRLTRKFGAATIYIWHDDKDVTEDVKRMVSFVGTKYGSVLEPQLRSMGTFEFRERRGNPVFYVTDIPRSKLKFETNDIAPFTMDIPLRSILREAQELEKEKGRTKAFYQTLIDVIDERMNSNEDDEELRAGDVV